MANQQRIVNVLTEGAEAAYAAFRTSSPELGKSLPFIGLLEQVAAFNFGNVERYQTIIAKLYMALPADKQEEFRQVYSVPYDLLTKIPTLAEADWPQPLGQEANAGSLDATAIRTAALERLEEGVSKVRQRMLTKAFGQDLVYAAKMLEVSQYAAAKSGNKNANLNPAAFPFLKAEIGKDYGDGPITNLQQAYEQVNERINVWKTNELKLQARKEAALQAVDAALTAPEVSPEVARTNAYNAATVNWETVIPELYLAPVVTNSVPVTEEVMDVASDDPIEVGPNPPVGEVD